MRIKQFTVKQIDKVIVDFNKLNHRSIVNAQSKLKTKLENEEAQRLIDEELGLLINEQQIERNQE